MRCFAGFHRVWWGMGVSQAQPLIQDPYTEEPTKKALTSRVLRGHNWRLLCTNMLQPDALDCKPAKTLEQIHESSQVYKPTIHPFQELDKEP